MTTARIFLYMGLPCKVLLFAHAIGKMTLRSCITKLCLHARGEVRGCQGDDAVGIVDNSTREVDNLSGAHLPLLGCSRKMFAPIGTAG